MRGELIFEHDSARDGTINLFSSPIDIVGLEGNTYDYSIEAYFETEGVNSSLLMTFNSDTAANYRRYRMTGDGSSASADVNEVQTNMDLNANSFSFAGLSMAIISGSSGDERHISISSALSASSSDTKVRLPDLYWKNTANELTSIQLSKSVSVVSTCHIMVYRTPKESNLDGYEYVSKLTWSAESTTKSFTSLDGDRDEEYRVFYNCDVGTTLLINNDTGNNYTRQRLRNVNGSISAGNDTATSISSGQAVSDMTLRATVGQKRLFTMNGGSKSTTSGDEQREIALWYSNTVTNITSIQINSLNLTITGTAKLYRKKKSSMSPDTLPFRVLESIPVSGDFSSGYTFSNLTGNDYRLLKLEYHATTGAGNIDLDIRINSSATANTRQRLTAATSSVTAQSSTDNTFTSPSAAVSKSVIYLYTRTGSQRTMLIESDYRENTIFRSAMWHADTVTEITDLLVLATSSTSTTGTLTLSILD